MIGFKLFQPSSVCCFMTKTTSQITKGQRPFKEKLPDDMQTTKQKKHLYVLTRLSDLYSDLSFPQYIQVRIHSYCNSSKSCNNSIHTSSSQEHVGIILKGISTEAINSQCLQFNQITKEWKSCRSCVVSIQVTDSPAF